MFKREKHPNRLLQAALASATLGVATAVVTGLRHRHRAHATWRSEHDIDVAVADIGKQLERSMSRVKRLAGKGDAEGASEAADRTVAETKQQLECLASDIKWHMGATE
jgi:hypothetical protein